MGYVSIDIFEDLKSKLNLNGEIVKTTNYIGDPSSYFGNATLFKKTLNLSDKRVVWMKDFYEVDSKDKDWASHPRAALSLNFNVNSHAVTVINTHMVWGITPFDEDYKIPQGKILSDYLKTIKNPFVLSGDFNLIRETQIMKSISAIGRDLATEKGITNTLNPNVHRLKQLFPKGLAIDYIFVSKDLKVNEFELVDSPDLSDHFGLKLIFEA